MLKFAFLGVYGHTPYHHFKKENGKETRKKVSKILVKSERWVCQNPMGKSYQLAKRKKIYLKISRRSIP